MATVINWSNFNDAKSLIEDALLTENVKPTASLICTVCGQCGDLDDLKNFARGAVYVPPDPFPLGTRVVDLRTERHGEVIEDKILSTAGPHRHRRQIAVQPDNGSGRSFCHADEDHNSITIYLVSEAEWDKQQSGGKS